MRTLTLQVQMSVDGFIASPDGDMDWMVLHGTDDRSKSCCKTSSKLAFPWAGIVVSMNIEGFIAWRTP